MVVISCSTLLMIQVNLLTLRSLDTNTRFSDFASSDLF